MTSRISNKIIALAKLLRGFGLRKEASDLESLPEGSGSANLTTFSGILKIMSGNPPTDLQDKFSGYFEENGLKKIDADRLHITLLHQDVLRPFAKAIKGKEILQYTGSITYGKVYSIKRSGDQENKHSVFVLINEQDAIKTYVKEVLKSLGLDENLMEEKRIYHVSLANKTGTTDQSVGHSEANNMTIGESGDISEYPAI
jgi:hypothetical protein